MTDDEETRAAIGHAIGRVCVTVRMCDDALVFAFSDGSVLTISDVKQECCEDRYMTCDDDLDWFSGARFISAETRDAPSVADDGVDHEVQFLVVRTSKGDITAETHNEHNGNYSGFRIRARLINPTDENRMTNGHARGGSYRDALDDLRNQDAVVAEASRRGIDLEP